MSISVSVVVSGGSSVWWEQADSGQAPTVFHSYNLKYFAERRRLLLIKPKRKLRTSQQSRQRLQKSHNKGNHNTY